MSKSDRVQTGISGLDKMLNGGFPKGRVILLVGGPGTGKTILSSQFIINGIEMYNENGIFVSMDEIKSHYLREMSAFGWSLKKIEEEKKWCFIDASPIKQKTSEPGVGGITRTRAFGGKDYTLSDLIEEIKSKVNDIDAKRIVVEPLTSLVFQYPNIVNRRGAILNLIETLTNTGATSILTTELKTSGLERTVQLEEYLAHGVIILQTLQVGKSSVRAIQIEKMRETSVDPQIRPYRITEKGIALYPKESVF